MLKLLNKGNTLYLYSAMNCLVTTTEECTSVQYKEIESNNAT